MKAFAVELVSALLARPLLAVVSYVRRNPIKSVVWLVTIILGSTVISALAVVGGLAVRIGLASQASNLFWSAGEWLKNNRRAAIVTLALAFPLAPVPAAALGAWLVADSLKRE